MENKILIYDSVEISFDGEAVVHDVSFSLTPGEILGLVGESGSGKSTLIKAAMGLLGSGGLVTRGNICYMGQNILDISEKEKRKIRGAGIGMIFQDAGASLCPIRTIGDQIYESMRAHKKVSRNEAKDHAMELFEKLNFKDSQRVWDSYPFELSGGMNQRAGIAISMLMNPPILLADEPTSALDVSVQRQVVREMLKLEGIVWNCNYNCHPRYWCSSCNGRYCSGSEKWKNGGIWRSGKGVEPSTGSLYEEAAGSSSKA